MTLALVLGYGTYNVSVLFLTEQRRNIYGPGPTLAFANAPTCIALLRIEASAGKMESAMAWFKDAAAGVGLVVFLVSSFVLTSAAQAFFAAG